MLDMESIKRDLKSEVKPRKVIRYALVPQVRGIANPLKDVFSILVKTIGLLFIQAKLIDADNPNAQGRGVGSIWAMIVDASARLEFRKEKIPQLTVFYSVVAMIVFSLFAAFTLVSHLLLGHAHAQSNSMFVDNSSTFSYNWLEFLFPYDPNNSAPTSDIGQALGATLSIYNTGILCIASLFALWSIIAMVVDSAHHGQWGGQRHSALYAPLRLVFAIGLLTPLAKYNNYNAAQIIVIQIAHMGAGLGNTVWTTFAQKLASISATQALTPVGDVDSIVAKLMMAGVCEEYYTKIYGPSGTNPDSTVNPSVNWTNPTPSNISIQNVPQQNGGNGTSINLTGYKVNFSKNSTDSDSDCGSIIVPAVSANLIAGKQQDWVTVMNTFYTNSIVPVADNIVNSAETSSSSGAKAANVPITWGDGSAVAGLTTTLKAAINTEVTSLVQSYTGSSDNATNAIVTQAEQQGWIAAGMLFVKMAKIAQDVSKVQGHSIAVSLPSSYIMPTPEQVSHPDDTQNTCAWYAFWCSKQALHVTGGLTLAYTSLSAAQAPYKTSPNIYGTTSASSGGDSSGIVRMIMDYSGLANIIGFFQGTGDPVHPNTSAVQPIFDAMFFGKMLGFASAGLFDLVILLSPQILGESAGSGVEMLLMLLGSILFPMFMMFSIYLPLMPTIRFLFGALTWFLSIFEALLALPVVALWHLRSEGEGLFAHGQQGYLMVLQMMLRPALMVFGLIGAVTVFDVMFNFISYAIFGTAANMMDNTTGFGGVDDVLPYFGYLIFYTFMVYSVANIAFNLINVIPDRILAWIGSAPGLTTQDEDVVGASKGAVGGIGGMLNARNESIGKIQQAKNTPVPPPTNQLTGGGAGSGGGGGGGGGNQAPIAAQLLPPPAYSNPGSSIGGGPNTGSGSGATQTQGGAMPAASTGSPLSFQGYQQTPQPMSVSPDTTGIVTANSYNGAFTQAGNGAWDRSGSQSVDLASDPTSPMGGGGTNLTAAALLPGDKPSASMTTTGSQLGSMANFDVGGGYQSFGGGYQTNTSVGASQFNAAASNFQGQGSPSTEGTAGADDRQASALLQADKQGLAAEETSDEGKLAAAALASVRNAQSAAGNLSTNKASSPIVLDTGSSSYSAVSDTNKTT